MRNLKILILGGAAAAASGQVVNIDARSDCYGVSGAATVALDPGIYILHPIGPPEGAFTAWNAWGGAVSGCDPSGSPCTLGWLRSYIVATDRHLFTPGAGIWSTDVGALAAAKPAQLRLCEAATVRFFVPDDACGDNIGGVSLRIEPHPCPADVNVDGALDFFDFLEFQNRFAAGDSRADFDCSANLDFFDFLAFQNAFAAGC